MKSLSGEFVLLTRDEYDVLWEQARLHREAVMTEEEREVMAEAMQLLQIHDMMGEYARNGGRINGRTIADRSRVIRRLMAKFDRWE